FWTEVTAPVTMCTSASRRTPDMPIGSRTPSPSSTMKFCGSTWMISRSWGRLIARAASTTRSTSASLTSRSRPVIGTTPRLFTPRMWPPAMPAKTPETSTPAICSASPTAVLIASTVDSMLTTTPRRVLAAQSHLDAVDRVQDGPLPAAHVDLRDLGGQLAAAAGDGPDQRDRRAGLRPRRGAHRRELVGRQAADDGQRGGHRLGRGAEQPPLLVHPVQAAAVHE